MNEVQQLKAYGHLIGVDISDLERASVAPSQTVVDAVLKDRFCGHPDYADPDIAASDDPVKTAGELGMDVPDCEHLIECHRRFEAYNNERWGKCYPDQFAGHSVTYFLDRDTFPAHYKRPVTAEELLSIVEAGVWDMTIEEVRDRFNGRPMLDVAYEMVDISYARVGIRHIPVDTGAHGEHNVHIKSVPIAGSTIGIAWFPSGSCSDHVNQHIDSTYRPGLLGTMKLGCHEWGHNHGEPHQFSGQSGPNGHHSVMSYSPPRLFYGFSTGQAPHTLPKDRSLDSLIEKYGGPIVEPDPVDPGGPMPPAGGQPWAEGQDGYLRIHGPILAGQHADFNIVPRTRI